MGQTALAVLLLIGFMFPLSILIYSHIKDKQNNKKSPNNPAQETNT